jgi:sec-independent protein translocase protein TatB
MFDIGFSELILIGVVALIVIGPERLPKVARTAGHLFGRFQRYASSVKADISREMELEELRKAGQSFKESVESAAHGVERQASDAEYTMRDEPISQDKVLDALGLADEQKAQAGVPVHDDRPLTQAPLDLQPAETAHPAVDIAKPADNNKQA